MNARCRSDLQVFNESLKSIGDEFICTLATHKKNSISYKKYFVLGGDELDQIIFFLF